ncbi:bifunctional nuclease family protein [Microbacterium sp. Sa4CUA7]|uniref:Bifunctional nuclease family protein n=1 Tax=Microbacterium pullorum TaxID=2762236 RepID=A0ABR8RYG4_9MICO|nr:bifunctional nuclease family protein [Microbacterium pullorum]MBD7956275.1 bifunctional nuclease family protein [Microbacterium pullorum]
MVQVRVAGVALDPDGQRVVLLKPIDALPGEGAILPIWIGAQEATSILIAVEGAVTPRPLAHDLMRSMLTTLGAEVDRVEVARIDDGTFYAEVTLSSPQGTQRVDARPSDAIALASRTAAPIFVADAVLAEAGIPDVLAEADAEENIEEFKHFIDDVEPDDFRES